MDTMCIALHCEFLKTILVCTIKGWWYLLLSKLLTIKFDVLLDVSCQITG